MLFVSLWGRELQVLIYFLLTGRIMYMLCTSHSCEAFAIDHAGA
jgi:hypothetical protein